jgi:HAD superfamily hydrolase (TIGR01662 family)
MLDSLNQQWVFMDAGDTFIYGYPTLYDAVQECWQAENAAIEKDRIKAVTYQFLKANPRNEYHSQERFEEYIRSLYTYILKELDFPGNHQKYNNVLWNDWETGRLLRLFDDVLPALIRLKNEGYKLGIITNWDTSFERTLKRLNADHFFEVVVVSCIENMAKPNPNIFELAFNRAGTSAHSCWYIGDHIEYDIKPSVQMGMKTIHVDYYQKGKSEISAAKYVHSFSLAVEHIISNHPIASVVGAGL